MIVFNNLIIPIVSLSLGVSALPQAFTGSGTDFGTYFCKTRGANGQVVASNNFCQAAGGSVLVSQGFCCIRNNNIKVLQAMAKGCNDNQLVFSQNDVPCSP
ncbi:hypothetical protein CDEST_02052 [Colletotrichum destructivum]|uniref:Uncharacterized protein n=1 Tax=Colletotrichum destructivum TaxID=34406 RepID=A0AAX4I1W4_9PEZI|nr:hypothetical protein CDEST_02052 [Colletotrichum destructivum]